MTRLPGNLPPPGPLRRALNALHGTQRLAGRLVPHPTSGMRTDVMAGGRKVLFFHNPRTGGRSLEAFFNVKRKSHKFPSEKLSERQWLDHFIVTSIRHPMDRFLSSYYGNILTPQRNGLVKQYGWGVKNLTPFEFLELIQLNPHRIGLQTQWTNFPSARKPRADLVLRLEEASEWEAQMRAAGLEIGDRRVPHRGKGKYDRTRHLERLKLTPDEFERLRKAVEAYYNTDYEVFGYKRGEPDNPA